MSDRAEVDDELGPIDFFAIEFPDGRVSTSGFTELLDLADRGVVRILDLEFVAKDAEGKVSPVEPGKLAASGEMDLSEWEGASSGLLDSEDIDQLGATLTPGGVAAAVVFENRWVLALVDAWRQDGARLIADGGLSATDVVAALDATEQD